MKKLFVMVLAVLAQTASRAETFPMSHLYQQMGKIKSLVDHVTSENCEANLKTVYEEITYVQPTQYSKAELLKEVDSLLESSLQLRQLIRWKMIAISRGEYSASCAAAVKRSLRALRGLEDYVGYVASSNGHELKLSDSFSNQFKLRSGDLLLSRGNAFTSATIARMGDEDLQFSHVAMVYIDPATQKIYTIEAHMEKGSVVAPFETYFTDGKVRSTLYRPFNSEVAARAAEIMYQKVKNASETTGNIPYDIEMELDNHDRIFCSEVVRQGYDEASEGTFMVPTHMTTFSMKNRSLFERLGSRAHSTFLPADIEADPRFEMINDWRDFSNINSAWRYDAIMTKVMEWMEQDNYQLKNTPFINVISKLAYGARRTPGLKKKLEDRMSLDMNHSMISTTLIFYIVVGKFEKKLKIIDENAVKKTGYPLTITQQIQSLETIKALKPKISGAFKPSKH